MSNHSTSQSSIRKTVFTSFIPPTIVTFHDTMTDATGNRLPPCLFVSIHRHAYIPHAHPAWYIRRSPIGSRDVTAEEMLILMQSWLKSRVIGRSCFVSRHSLAWVKDTMSAWLSQILFCLVTGNFLPLDLPALCCLVVVSSISASLLS